LSLNNPNRLGAKGKIRCWVQKDSHTLIKVLGNTSVIGETG